MGDEPESPQEEAMRLLLSLGGRHSWGLGPWGSEGDATDWTDLATGLACAIRRNAMGAWCGSVGVPRGHLTYKDEAHVSNRCRALAASVREAALDLARPRPRA